MKKITIFLFILTFGIYKVEGQQIKRSTLTSTGTLKTVTPFRVSWTAGSCPGCNVLHPTNPPNAGYTRQGFQQPPFNGNAPGCPSLTPTFNIIPFVSPTCGTKFDFEYTGGQTPNLVVEWNFGEGAVPQTSKELNPSGIIYTSSSLKIVTLKVSSGPCVDSRAKTVIVSATQIGFSALAQVSNIKCRNESTGNITLTTIGGTGAKTYRWSNGAVTQNLTKVVAGRYRVTTTDANGCNFSLDTVITQPTTALSFTNTIIPETCKDYEDGTIELTPSGGTKPYTVSWSNGATAPNISGLIAGQYRVTILDSNNCRLDTSFIVNRRCRLDTTVFHVYDVITPNGDGNNDKWVIVNIEKYPNNEMFIYNRWGQLVYTKKAYLSNWEGTNQEGKELSAGAYFYLIKLNDDKNTTWEGSVTILR